MAVVPKSPRSLNKRNRNGFSLTAIASHFLVGVCGIYVGISMGSFTCPKPDPLYVPLEKSGVPPPVDRKMIDKMVAEKLAETLKQADKIKFPKKIEKIVMDYATIPRDDFNKNLEIGVPPDETKKGSEEVLMLYTDPRTLPFQEGKEKEKKYDVSEKHGLGAEKALENCHTVKVILQEPANKKRQCIAIVPQWESYHVHKFTRIPKESTGKDVSVEYPLRYTSRTMAENGRVSGIPTWTKHTRASNDALVDYLSHLDTSLANLKPLLEKAVTSSKNTKESKAIIVMVCNKGQAHLFHNFVCNARSKGLDLSRIVMFATDQYTVDLCKKLGIEVFHDENIFGSMPEHAAARYGDKIFSMMMMAKVYCVHLVMTLGYDVLFQDVDVVWQKNPLEYLETEESEEWDMLFQDDGSRQIRYQPYSPNTGFYFVRNNDLTQYFFNSLLKKGDLIAATKSHQAALASQIAEFVSWKGMRVKVWRKFGTTLFPGGAEYHQSQDYMRRMIAGEVEPFIFHMSWTQNKDNKKLYFEQMAEWYTKEPDSKCDGLDCCVAEPIITCHYRDKPSKIPCKDSPPIDKGKKSFWK